MASSNSTNSGSPQPELPESSGSTTTPPAAASDPSRARYVAFRGTERVAFGELEAVATAIAEHAGAPETLSPVLLFETTRGQQIEVDATLPAEGIVASVLARRRGRGRPKMGVNCGEVCLLPRHWDWLSAQPRSASATIRRLIDAARKAETPEDRLRERVDATHAILWAIAGDLPDFEEACRALYAHDWPALRSLTIEWPAGIRAEMHDLLGDAQDG